MGQLPGDGVTMSAFIVTAWQVINQDGQVMQVYKPGERALADSLVGMHAGWQVRVVTRVVGEFMSF